MADEPISSLTLFTSYSTADEVEILDVSDTTFASTGTNKRIQFSTLLTMAGVGTVAGGGTGLTAAGAADQLLGVQHTGGGLEYKTLTAGANITITPAAGSLTIASTASGGLTSVGLSAPSWLTVSNSPLTSNGTLAVSATTGETANQVLATPNGSSGAVGLRSIVAADLPTVPTSGGGTGLTSIGTADQVLGVAHTGGALEYKTLTAGANVTITDAAGQITIASSGTGSGTVNSVGLSTPSWLTVANSPITGSGTLAVTATTGETANQVLATPNGSSGALAVRALAAADIPTLPASQITAPGSSGQLIYNSSNLFTGAADLTVGSSGQLNLAAISAPGSPAAGDLWYDSARNTFGFLSAGMVTQPSGIIWQAIAPGTAASGSNFVSVIQGTYGPTSTIGSLRIPATTLKPGKIIRPHLFGTGTPANGSTPTFLFLLGGTQIWSYSTAAPMGSTAGYWQSGYGGFSGYQVISVTSGTSIYVTGAEYVIFPNGAGSVGTAVGGLNASGTGTSWISPPSGGISVPYTGSLAIDFQVKFSGSGSMTLLGGWIEILG